MLMLLNPFVQRRKPNPKIRWKFRPRKATGRWHVNLITPKPVCRSLCHSLSLSQQKLLERDQNQTATRPEHHSRIDAPTSVSPRPYQSSVTVNIKKSIEALVLPLLRLARYELWEAKPKSSRDDVYKYITNRLMLSTKPKPTGHTAGTHAIFDSARKHFLAKRAMAL